MRLQFGIVTTAFLQLLIATSAQENHGSRENQRLSAMRYRRILFTLPNGNQGSFLEPIDVINVKFISIAILRV